MKIEMFTSMFEVRSMCIKHDYCTMMDNAEYDKMLRWAEETDFTEREVETLAKWIAEFSDFSMYANDPEDPLDPVASVAYSIMNEAITWIPIME